MIQQLFVHGIKTFIEPTTLECRPLTVLTGSNSCGKSTILQTILLLKQLALARSRPSPYVRLNGPVVAQGSYKDWSSNQEAGTMSLGMKLGLCQGDDAVEAEITVQLEQAGGGRAPGDARLRCVSWASSSLHPSGGKNEYGTVVGMPSTDDVARKIESVFSDRDFPDVGPEENEIRVTDESPYVLHVTVDGSTVESLSAAVSVSGLIPVAVDGGSSPRRPYARWFSEQLEQTQLYVHQTEPFTEQELPRLLGMVHHLGPLRDEPRMIYSGYRAGEPWDVGARGERAAVALAEYGEEVILAPKEDLSPGHRAQRLSDAVAEWARRIGVTSGMKILNESKHGTEIQVSAAYSSTRAGASGITTDLVNVGTGVSQVLPVLVLCLAAPPGSTILVEQPELHLHPAVQSKLCDFFAACALSGRQIIVETHSEHLINRLRLLSAQGKLRPNEHVSLNFIERDEFGSEITQIGLREDGTLDRWPRGFFDETQAALRALMAERLS